MVNLVRQVGIIMLPSRARPRKALPVPLSNGSREPPLTAGASSRRCEDKSSSLGKVRTLQLFSSYLPEAENWCYRLLAALPDTEVRIGAPCFVPGAPFGTGWRRAPGVSVGLFSRAIGSLDSGNKALRLMSRGLYGLVHRLYAYHPGHGLGAPQLMHSHFATNGWFYRRIQRRLEIPHVVSFYGFDYERLPFTRPVWVSRYQQLFRFADRFICEGSHGASLLESNGCPPEKISVIRLGVDPEKVLMTRRRKAGNELRLVQVARMTEKKGHTVALEAFARALGSCANMYLTFVGTGTTDEDGTIPAELRRIVQREGLASRVSFVERVEFSGLYEFLQDFHLLIQPSHYSRNRDSEGGSPVVLLDAQATGMPVVATTHCDIPEAVVHGETGFLSPERDIVSLSSHIRRFYEMRQDSYDRFALQARRHIEREYDIRESGRRLRQIYEALLERKGIS